MPLPKWNAGSLAASSNEDLNDKISRAGVEAARRKFTPEFMNRIDKVVVFRSLGTDELSQILNIELNHAAAAHFQLG